MKYYYNINKTNHGPVSKEKLDALAEVGVIQAQTPVIEAGKKEWSTYGKIAGEMTAKIKTPVLHVQQPTLTTPSVLKAAPTSLSSSTPSPADENEPEGFAARIHSIYSRIDHVLESIKLFHCHPIA